MLPAGGNLLEIRCATGFMWTDLQTRMGFMVTGVELDPDQAAAAREHCRTLIEGNIAEPAVQADLSTMSPIP